MLINFENCPVTVSQTDFAADLELFASSITISETLPIETLAHLGSDSLSGGYPVEPPNGTIDVDFYISGSNDITPFLELKKASYEQADLIDVTVGPYTVEDAVLTSYQITAQSNDIITANVGLDYYGELSQGAAVSQAFEAGKLAYGANSTGTFSLLGFSTAPFSFSYSLNQGFEIIRELGNYEVDVALWRDGNETISVEGYDLPTGVVGAPRSTASSCWFFPQTGRLEFVLKNNCGTEYATIAVTGDIASRDITVSEDNVVNGTIEVVSPL